MKNRKIILLCIIIALLIAVNVFLIVNIQKPDYTIRIGKPTMNENHFVSSIDYTQSTPLKSKDDVDTVLFSLLSGYSVDEPPVAQSAPDAVLQIFTSGEYPVAYHVTMWLDGDSIVFSMGINDWSHFKRIDYAENLIKLIEKYMNLYA